MAKNTSRNMLDELEWGINDGTYMVLHPNWGGPMREPRTERMGWPNYRLAKRDVPRKNIADTVPMQSNEIYTVPRNHPAF